MNESLILILLGAPGAGKGTYCKELKSRYGTTQISTGDMFRAAVKEGSELGVNAKAFMDQGSLVPDDVVVGLVRQRIKEPDCAKGFILDGFPRTISQAESLVGLMQEAGMHLRVVIDLDVEREVLLRRLSGRRMCRKCDKGNFNVFTLPPKKPGVCDFCGGELYQRGDDTETVILNRLKVYEQQTQPLIDYYGKRGQLVSVPFKGDVGTMTARIFDIIDSRAPKA